MRNRILSITRSVIPYVKELHPLTGSVHGCLIMQQLDYWFTPHPDGFYKFLEPTAHASYKSGDSWVEELGMTHNEFRGAFDKIGVRYKSRTEFEAAKKSGKDIFDGKYYLSFVDRKKNLTYYLRNHQLLDLALDELINAGRNPPARLHQNSAAATVAPQRSAPTGSVTNCSTEIFPVAWNSDLQSLESGFTGNLDTKLQGIQIPSSRNADTNLYKPENQSTLVSETTTETTTTTTKTLEELSTGLALSNLIDDSSNPATVQQPPRGCGGDSQDSEAELIWPTCSIEDKTAITGLLTALPLEQHQILLDEIEGARSAGTIRVGLVPFAGGLVRAMLANKFTPGHSPRIANRRREQATSRDQITAARNHPEISLEDLARGQAALARITGRTQTPSKLLPGEAQ